MEIKNALTIVGRPINGISLNGLEYLLNQEGTDYMYFKNKEEAKMFLLSNDGLEDLTDDELEDSFRFKRVIYQTICNDHHGGDIVDDIFPNKIEAGKRFEELKETSGYCRYEEAEVLEDDTLDNNDTIESFYAEDEICPNCGDSENISKNSSGDIQCENCGFDEGNDEPKSN